MQSGKLNTKITIKRLVKTEDEFGGFNSTLSDVATVWCDLKEVSGEIKDSFGKRLHSIQIEIITRKRTADLIEIGDIFTVENKSQKYRINEKYEYNLDYGTKLIATRSE